MIAYALILISIVLLFLFAKTKKISKRKKENVIYLVGFISAGILGIANLLNSTSEIKKFFKSDSKDINISIDSYNDSIKYKTKINNRKMVDSLKKDLPLNIFINKANVNNNLPYPKDEFGIGFDQFAEIKYNKEIRNGQIYINPKFPYLSDFNSGMVKQFYLSDNEFLRYPTLDFKITNNSENTIFFNKAEFLIEKSEVDKNPFFFIWDVYEAEVFLQNFGWTDLKNIKLFFSFYPSDMDDKNIDFHKFKYKKILNNNFDEDEGDLPINFKEELKIEGINKDSLDNIAKNNPNINYQHFIFSNMKHLKYKYNKSDECELKIAGIIEFDNFYNGKFIKHYVKKFSINTTLCHSGRGSGGDISQNFDIVFSESKINYKVIKSISKVIKPKDTERFTFTIASLKSTENKFKVRLYYNNDNQYIESEIINLNIFSPNHYSGSIKDSLK